MITASVVLYKTPIDQVESVLNCVIKSNTVDKIYVIDNSPDDSLMFVNKLSPNIHYIKHQNTGYGSSHNLALEEACTIGSTYHVVLNPDIFFEPNVLHELRNYMNINTDTVYLLPKVVYPDGDIQYLCKQLPNPFIMFARRFLPMRGFVKKLNDSFELRHSGYDKIINPPCLSGCFMFLRLSAIEQYQIFFDDRFFMYYEDFDLIRRLHRIGKTIFYPEVSIVHKHARAAHTSIRMLFVFIKSTFQYFNKYGWFFDGERRLFNTQILEDINQIGDKK